MKRISLPIFATGIVDPGINWKGDFLVAHRSNTQTSATALLIHGAAIMESRTIPLTVMVMV